MKYELLCFDIYIDKVNDNIFVISITENEDVLKDHYDKDFYVEYVLDMKNCTVEYSYDNKYNINKIVKGLGKQIKKQLYKLCEVYKKYVETNNKDKLKSFDLIIYDHICDDISKFCGKLVNYLNIPKELLSTKSAHSKTFIEKYKIAVAPYYYDILRSSYNVLSVLLNENIANSIVSKIEEILYDEEIVGIFTFDNVKIFTDGIELTPQEFIDDKYNKYSKMLCEFLASKINGNFNIKPYDVYLFSRKNGIVKLQSVISRALSKVIPIDSEIYTKISNSLDYDVYNLIISSILIDYGILNRYLHIDVSNFDFNSVYSVFYNYDDSSNNLHSCVVDYGLIIDDYYSCFEVEYIAIFINIETLVNFIDVINKIYYYKYNEEGGYEISDIVYISDEYYKMYEFDEYSIIDNIKYVTIGRRLFYKNNVNLFGYTFNTYDNIDKYIINKIMNNDSIKFFEKPYGTFDTIMYLNYYSIKLIYENYENGLINLSENYLLVINYKNNYTNVVNKKIYTNIYMFIENSKNIIKIKGNNCADFDGYKIYYVQAPYQDTFSCINTELFITNHNVFLSENYSTPCEYITWENNSLIFGVCKYCLKDIFLANDLYYVNSPCSALPYFIKCPYCSGINIVPLYKRHSSNIIPISLDFNSISNVWNFEKVDLLSKNYKIGTYFPLVVAYDINYIPYSDFKNIDNAILYAIYRLLIFRVITNINPGKIYEYDGDIDGEIYYCLIRAHEAIRELFENYEYIKLHEYNLQNDNFSFDKIKRVGELYVEYVHKRNNKVVVKRLDDFLDELLPNLYWYCLVNSTDVMLFKDTTIYVVNNLNELQKNPEDVFCVISKEFIKLLIAYYIYSFFDAISEQFTISKEYSYEPIIKSITYNISGMYSKGTIKIDLQNNKIITYGNVDSVVDDLINYIDINVNTFYGSFNIRINYEGEYGEKILLTLINYDEVKLPLLSKLYGMLLSKFIIIEDKGYSKKNIIITCDIDELLPFAYMFLNIICLNE